MSRYLNPSHEPCWETCSVCYRCANKGRYTKCNKCSGRHDPFLRVDPDPDDFCQCTEGVLRWRAKNGQLVIRKYNGNPFENKIQTEKITEDEKDWNAYLDDMREKLDDSDYNPIQII